MSKSKMFYCGEKFNKNSSVKWTVLAHFKSQPRGQIFEAQIE